MKLFNHNHNSGFEIVIMNRKPGLFTWKMVNQEGKTVLLPPVNVNKYDSFEHATDAAIEVFKQLNITVRKIEAE